MILKMPRPFVEKEQSSQETKIPARSFSKGGSERLAGPALLPWGVDFKELPGAATEEEYRAIRKGC